MTAGSVVLTQPYIANYRLPLLGRIAELLAREGVGFQVYTGAPGGQQAMRHDASNLLATPYAASMPSRSISFGERHLEWRRLPRTDSTADVFVTELSAQNLLGWQLALDRRRPCILWGHGRTYTHRASSVSTALKVRLAKMATHSMLYSQDGSDYLERRGVPSRKLTVIGNATDSTLLRAELMKVTDAERSDLRTRLDIEAHANIALFVGGLDADKRIGFLLEAAAAARAVDPDFRLLILGRGKLEDDVRRYQAGGGPIRWLGVAGPELVAVAGAISRCIWMPGRIGLVAVDALVLKLPVHTTGFAFHAPEAGLLVGSTKLILPDGPEQFALESLRAMAAPGPSHWPSPPTVEQVAIRFVDVVLHHF